MADIMDSTDACFVEVAGTVEIGSQEDEIILEDEVVS